MSYTLYLILFFNTCSHSVLYFPLVYLSVPSVLMYFNMWGSPSAICRSVWEEELWSRSQLILTAQKQLQRMPWRLSGMYVTMIQSPLTELLEDGNHYLSLPNQLLPRFLNGIDLHWLLAFKAIIICSCHI